MVSHFQKRTYCFQYKPVILLTCAELENIKHFLKLFTQMLETFFVKSTKGVNSDRKTFNTDRTQQQHSTEI